MRTGEIDVITPIIASDDKYLEKAVKSLESVDLNISHYVIGPKTDEIKRINENYAFVKLVEAKGLSVSEARNVGIEHSDSSIITFLDCDDQYTDEHLPRMKRKLGDVDIVWTDMILKNGNQSIKTLPEPVSPCRFYRQFRAIPLSALGLRRSALNGVRFRPNIDLGEGIDFVTRILVNAKSGKIKTPGVIKGVREGSLSLSMSGVTRMKNQYSTAIGIAKQVPKCRKYLPIVLMTITWRVIRDYIETQVRRMTEQALNHS